MKYLGRFLVGTGKEVVAQSVGTKLKHVCLYFMFLRL